MSKDLSLERLLEMLHIAEVAGSQPTPGYPARQRFDAEFIPGTVARILELAIAYKDMSES